MKKTKQLTFSAMMAALSTVMLFLGSLLDVFDLSAVLIATVFVFVVVTELGNAWGFGTYLVCSAIAFLLLPSKLIAVEFIIFGSYPVIRSILENVNIVLRIILKAIYMVVSTTGIMVISIYIFSSDINSYALWLKILIFLAGIFALVLVDIFFNRFSVLYQTKIRKMLRLDRFFKD